MSKADQRLATLSASLNQLCTQVDDLENNLRTTVQAHRQNLQEAIKQAADAVTETTDAFSRETEHRTQLLTGLLTRFGELESTYENHDHAIPKGAQHTCLPRSP